MDKIKSSYSFPLASLGVGVVIYPLHKRCDKKDTSYGVETDDAFLKAMMSETQFDDIIKVSNITKENYVLKPLAAFLGIACEIWGEPITEWDEHNVKIAVEKYGWGHTKCWNSNIGQLRLLFEFRNKIQGKQ